MKKYLSAVVMLVALCSLAISGRATIVDKTVDLPDIVSVSPEEFEPVRASVVNSDPSHFTIDVRKFANIGADEEAPVFAVYLTKTLPDKCGDFRDLDLQYWKPSKYRRTFDLRDHKDVMKAVEGYGCIVMRNVPAKG